MAMEIIALRDLSTESVGKSVSSRFAGSQLSVEVDESVSLSDLVAPLDKPAEARWVTQREDGLIVFLNESLDAVAVAYFKYPAHKGSKLILASDWKSALLCIKVYTGLSL